MEANSSYTFPSQTEAYKRFLASGVELKSSEKVGRFVVSTKSWKKGDLIWTQQPYGAAVDPTRIDLCSCCFKLSAKTLRCSKCKYNRYCSTECQLKDWNEGHKSECAVISRIPATTADRLTAVMAVRIFLKFHRQTTQGHDETQDGPAELLSMYNQAAGLDSSERETLETNVIQYAQLLAKVLPAEVGLDIEKMAYVLLRIVKSSFSTADIYNDQNGIAIYPTAALFNHACVPNAIVYFDNKQIIRIVALNNIDAGDEINISYKHSGTPAWSKRRDMKREMGFWCQCRTCLAYSAEATDQQILGECFTCSELSNLSVAIEKGDNLSSSMIQSLEALYTKFTSIDPKQDTPMDISHAFQASSTLYRFLACQGYPPNVIPVMENRIRLYNAIGTFPEDPYYFGFLLQVGIVYLRHLKWKEAVLHLKMALEGMKFAKSPLIEETNILYEMARDPHSFSICAGKLLALPRKTPLVEDLIHNMFEILTAQSSQQSSKPIKITS